MVTMEWVTLPIAIPIVPVPGPSAALAALVCSGFYITPFQFVGFVKRSGSERSRQQISCYQSTNRLRTIAASPSTTILYESSHRICETLDDLAGTLGGDRRVCICRELTKLHETITRLSLQEVLMRRSIESRPVPSFEQAFRKVSLLWFQRD